VSVFRDKVEVRLQRADRNKEDRKNEEMSLASEAFFSLV
jgi:hypothetical protein